MFSYFRNPIFLLGIVSWFLSETENFLNCTRINGEGWIIPHFKKKSDQKKSEICRTKKKERPEAISKKGKKILQNKLNQRKHQNWCLWRWKIPHESILTVMPNTYWSLNCITVFFLLKQSPHFFFWAMMHALIRYSILPSCVFDR